MKKVSLLLAIILIASGSFAQSDKYISAMKANISQLDSAVVTGKETELANNFARIGDAEKTQWLPYYYAAYCTIIEGLVKEDKSGKDAIADKAKNYIDKAETILGKENSETDVIKAMIATVHMTVDPQSRYMTYGTQINDLIQKSENLDSTNPRPVLLKAENVFYTPEAFHGGKVPAKPIFEKASALFDAFKPETELSPNWGKTTVQYFLSQYN
jgi:hypothetical protein